MNDIPGSAPDHQMLFDFATEQHGYFTAGQAAAAGFSSSLLSYHAQTGRVRRVRRGLFRLRDFPSFHREEVVIAWMSLGKDVSVVSHASALDLLDLSDVMPDAVHLTVPRSKRKHPAVPGTRVHTTTRSLDPDQVVTREGIRVTNPTRTILDAAQSRIAPDQVEMAIVQAIDRGLTTTTRLTRAARAYPRRVSDLVDSTLRHLNG